MTEIISSAKNYTDTDTLDKNSAHRKTIKLLKCTDKSINTIKATPTKVYNPQSFRHSLWTEMLLTEISLWLKKITEISLWVETLSTEISFWVKTMSPEISR